MSNIVFQPILRARVKIISPSAPKPPKHLLQEIIFLGSPHTKQKKIVQKPPHSSAGSIVEPYNATKLQFWPKWVKVVMFMHMRSHASHVARGRKTLQMHGFPLQTYGITSKGHN